MPSCHVYGWCWTCRCIVITKFLFFISKISPFVGRLLCKCLISYGWSGRYSFRRLCIYSVVNLQISFVWTCRSIFDYPFSMSFHLSSLHFFLLLSLDVKISLSSTICFNAPFAQLFLWLSTLHLRSLHSKDCIRNATRCGKKEKKCLCILLESKRTEDVKWTRPYTSYS